VKHVFRRAAKEGGLVLVVAVVVGLTFNRVRPGGIPFIAAADAFRIQTKAEFITPEDAAKFFDAGNAFFIDARDAGAYAAEHIEGALNADPGQAGVDSLAWIAAANPYVIAYASKASQRQAGVLADKLVDAGFKKVYVLLDGIEAWKSRGLPIEGKAE
jgi:rhodanese-related sulfurtransferase